MKMLSRRSLKRREGLGLPQANEPMRQFLIDRAQTLHYEVRQFPETRRVAENWIRLALRFAKQAGDMELYRQISREDALCGTKTEKIALI